MCGRFTLITTLEYLISEFDIQLAFDEDLFATSYNIAPTQPIVSIINDGTNNRMGHLKWGLIPTWAKDETVDEKPSFKRSFYQRRCIIPMDSFYEWKRDGKAKIPMRIKMKDDSLFGVAGLWETWKASNGTAIHTCTILTTEPNELMADIHDRMPVILPKEMRSVWLNPAVKDKEELKSLLVPYKSDDMTAYEVSDKVNSPRNNTVDLIERV